MGAARWIIVIWLGTVVVSTVLVGWIVLWHRLVVQRDAMRLQAAFDALCFPTPVGPVMGDALTVVKIAYQLDGHDPDNRTRAGPAHWDSLWYAAGPGPSYFLAICTFDARTSGMTPRWAVRCIDEARMRAALTDDVRAQMLAFGEAIEA
ncbi:hypothetical protein [Lysobacter auxotrophicus]|uniref:Uncharacterized protein n=1 Tax=Lysobacter auxotrophicus TaxID=2992573 RepID=A0ABN6UIE1_9GAMM|nr:hypothetical protein [Lysobacter auxotrophicus]BDU16044.1 hypothetical protein LA521A_12450 [Lysobacter auxotrophicus]